MKHFGKLLLATAIAFGGFTAVEVAKPTNYASANTITNGDYTSYEDLSSGYFKMVLKNESNTDPWVTVTVWENTFEGWMPLYTQDVVVQPNSSKNVYFWSIEPAYPKNNYKVYVRWNEPGILQEHGSMFF